MLATRKIDLSKVELLSHNALGDAGETWAEFRAQLEGFRTLRMPKGNPQYDITLLGVDARVSVKASPRKPNSKGLPSRTWTLNRKAETDESGDLYYAFVDFNQADLPVYVVPSGVVREHVIRTQVRWMATPKKDGQQHADSDRRSFHYAKPAAGYPEGWLEEYRNAWNLIGKTR